MFATAAAMAGAAALFAASTPASADDHVEAAAAPSLEQVLTHERRSDDAHRDQYRHPVETLEFFGVEPTMTVAEFGPGGGWYTRVLAPWIMPQGTYIAFNGDSDGRNYRDRAQEVRAKSWTENFARGLAQGSGMDVAEGTVFEIDEMPEAVEGTVDRVLIFRSMHGLANGNTADDVLDAAYRMLKPDGMVGVVQHRAPADASFADYSPAPGYMKTEQVVAIFAANGFELVESSEINANPDDPANWERGVWTLPPVLATGEDDPRRDEYLGIGESDRMTLLFRKMR
ncbi:class I SAM-dependent methyltransferase [Qipengyuania nanhaisediminis]|uniref:class I SAM-dependent methyltransferase n=1 Tax=Qipengyuania nanhaisediminis TaxID=604088 RepID=UPI0038B29B4C